MSNLTGAEKRKLTKLNGEAKRKSIERNNEENGKASGKCSERSMFSFTYYYYSTFKIVFLA